MGLIDDPVAALNRNLCGRPLAGLVLLYVIFFVFAMQEIDDFTFAWLRNRVDLDGPVSFFDQVFLGCTRREHKSRPEL